MKLAVLLYYNPLCFFDGMDYSTLPLCTTDNLILLKGSIMTLIWAVV